jgi:hypothetical protein
MELLNDCIEFGFGRTKKISVTKKPNEARITSEIKQKAMKKLDGRCNVSTALECKYFLYRF